MPRQLPASLIALALGGCLGARPEPEPVPVPPPAEVHNCPLLPPPACDWAEPGAAPADLVGLEAALEGAWRALAGCAENAASARREWAACPGNQLEIPR